MLIYGDHSDEIEPNAALVQLTAQYGALADMPAGIVRHAALVGLFVDATTLAQALEDAAFAERGSDDLSPSHGAALRLLVILASAVDQSWTQGFTGELPDIDRAAEVLRASSLPPVVVGRRLEGFAFYGVYPELFLSAARACAEPLGLVLGLRSIGMGLAALVASVHPGAVVASLRPKGPPFRRVLALTQGLKAVLINGRHGHAAIVDEGPGLSGSSFASASEALEDLGFAPERIHFFPSHAGGPGAEASADIRRRWNMAPRHLAGFEETILQAPNPTHRLATWCSDLTGPALAPLEDIGAGGWRRHRAGADHVPVQRQWERRKYLLRSEAGTFLLRFAGLGRYGAGSLRRAELLSRAGFTPRVLGLRHGFLVQEWLGDARFLQPFGADRAVFIGHLTEYLSFRARHLPAGPGSGASLTLLTDMLVTNAQLAVGASWPASRLSQQAQALQPRVRRVETDNRLHRWEWMVASGQMLKADAFDHCAAHDLVGCQDIAWDVAGAIVEFQFNDEEGGCLIEAVGSDRELVAFLQPCYLAAQLAGWSYSLADPHLNMEDKATIRKKYNGYIRQLHDASGKFR